MKEITPRTEPARLGLAHAALTGLILEVFYEVYNELGSGFLESVYRRAFKIALEARSLAVVEEAVILEIQAARALDSSHEAKLLHYLRATDKEVGLLMNFGPKPTFKRFYFDNPRKEALGSPTT